MRNFDDLAPKFARKVYGGLKGKIRLSVIERDLKEHCARAVQAAGKDQMVILDAGCGHGPVSLKMARHGHHIDLCDISQNMLDLAGKTVEAQGLDERVTFIHGDVHSLDPSAYGPYDLILCHAVLDWVPDPPDMLRHLSGLIKPGGILSLTFYNLDGFIFKNLLRANYKKIKKEDFKGFRGSLTPTFPRRSEDVYGWLSGLPVDILCHSGIRVFHDYILDPGFQNQDPDSVVELELKFSRQPPFRDMGRYQHIMARFKP